MTKAERIHKGLYNIKHLVKGWNAHLFGKSLSKQEMDKLKICNDCEHCVDDEWLDVVDDKVEECKGSMCDLCGCPNLVLVRTNKKCEANKW